MTTRKLNQNQKPYEILDLYPVEATLWERRTKQGVAFYTVQIIRKFKDESGYRGTPSYGQREADKFIQAAQWAKERLTVLNQKGATNE